METFMSNSVDSALYNLDTHPEEIMADPRMETKPMCRTTIRVRRWQDQTMRELLSRPVFSITLDVCNEVKTRVWESCDDELKSAIEAFMEKANG